MPGNYVTIRGGLDLIKRVDEYNFMTHNSTLASSFVDEYCRASVILEVDYSVNSPWNYIYCIYQCV